MRAPEFWWTPDGGARAAALLPLAWAWTAAAAARRAWTRPVRVAVPIVCVGNLTVGGAGKTPVVDDLALRLAGRRPHILLRGHGGRERGPLRVDPDRHDAAAVGDEALLHARRAPTWIGGDRRASAAAAIAAGAGLLLLDDGHQNPGLAKDLALLVVDGASGFGNGRVVPAGPLREPVAAGLARAHAVVVMGPDRAGLAAALAGGPPVLRAALVPDPEHALALAGRAVVAFAGIGRPEKFFATLEELGARLVARAAFADHHPYDGGDLAGLARRAEADGARLVTTAKDLVRVPPAWRDRVTALAVRVRWDDPAALDRVLERLG